MGHNMDDGVMLPPTMSSVLPPPPSASAFAGCKQSDCGSALYVDYGSSREGDVDMEVDREMNSLLPFHKSVHAWDSSRPGPGGGRRGEGAAEDGMRYLRVATSTNGCSSRKSGGGQSTHFALASSTQKEIGV